MRNLFMKVVRLNAQSTTIFDKIINKEIGSQIVYEDQKCLAFKDINAQAPVHLLLIPKEKGNLDRLENAKEQDIQTLGYLMFKAKEIAKQQGLGDGFRIVVNNGNHGEQTVEHLHLHILGGCKLGWPPVNIKS